MTFKSLKKACNRSHTYAKKAKIMRLSCWNDNPKYVKAKKTGPRNGHSSVIFPSWKPEGISKNGNNTICLA